MIVFVIFFSLLAASNGASSLIHFDLSSYDPSDKSTHSIKQLRDLDSDLTRINFSNIPDSVGFFIIQVHSFINNVTLASTESRETETSIEGTNLGLVCTNLNSPNYFVFVNNDISYNFTVLLAIQIYQSNDPIPGGCNLSFDTLLAPYQLISYSDELITVQSQAASINGFPCEAVTAQVEFYHLFLYENILDKTIYFDGLLKMLTVNDIRANGYRVPSVEGYFKYRKLYNAYRGTGEVFAIVASFENRTSAYVPAVSYSCDIKNWAEDCSGPVSGHWKMICALLLIFGIFICFYGHKFFKTTIYLFGLTTGLFETYTILSLMSVFSIEEKTSVSFVVGLIFGSFWLLLWWKYGIPILSVSLTFFLAALLISSIFFYTGLADFAIFRDDFTYWAASFTIIVICFIIWAKFGFESHIFACSFLGAYAFITAFNYYTGGNLQYIIINSFRRLVAKNYNLAIIQPPFQLLDITHTIFWAVLTAFGIYKQLREQRGKPPFPPNRNSSVLESVTSERTSLLNGSPVNIYVF